MPFTFVLLRLSLVALVALGVTLASRRWRVAGPLVAFVVLVLVPLQLVLQKWPRPLASLGWTNIVFFAELWPELAIAIAAAAWRAPRERGPRVRVAVLSLVLVACAVWHSWGVVAPRARVRDQAWVQGMVVRQTAPSSCAPAAAATLLRALAIDASASEQDLAASCLTDARRGTTDLALWRGLSLAVAPRRATFTSPGSIAAVASSAPCLIFVGLDRARAGALYAELLERCNWNEGEQHAVVLFGLASRNGRDLALVGDPSYGFEEWPIDHFRALWDGTALEVR